MKNRIEEVIERYVGEDYPGEIDRKFRRWLTDDDGKSAEKDRCLSQLWQCTDGSRDESFDRSFARMQSLTGISDRRDLKRLRHMLRRWRVSAAAAAVVAVVAIAVNFISTGLKTDTDLLQAYIPKAEMSTITLPDGTVAIVNANSTLLYPVRFDGATRSVYLTGEACFKVHPDKEHPFIVKSSDFQVTAIGTEFNVSAYPSDDLIEATLIEGKVKVEFDNLSRSEVLEPGLKLSYIPSTRRSKVDKADIDDATAWQRGEIVMRSLTADEIFSRLARRYPCTFVYNPSLFGSDRFTLTFGPDASLHEVMDIISKVMGNINYRIDGQTCRVEPSKRD